jgi:hypothetical protein
MSGGAKRATVPWVSLLSTPCLRQRLDELRAVTRAVELHADQQPLAAHAVITGLEIAFRRFSR